MKNMTGQAVMVQRIDGNYKFTATPTVLRQIIFHIGDLVWPGWFEHPKGRKIYIDYADRAAEDGHMTVDGGKYFCNAGRYEEVKRRLKEADVEIFESE